LTHIHAGPHGSTPLGLEERDGLIRMYIATCDELNAAEQANIAAAVLCFRRRRLTTGRVLHGLVVRSSHKAIYRDVWKWADKYRRTERNIGVDLSIIAISVRDLVEDASSRAASEDTRLVRDQAVRLVRHRLGAIHPFPNANGRHARTFADLLMPRLGGDPLTWGATGIRAGPNRQAYLDALRLVGCRL
jgi:Fic-DOC domain mobile mystery protein B